MADSNIAEAIMALGRIKTTGNPFSIKPKHWWSYLNPLWWKTKRIAERVLEYQWEHGGKEEIEKRIKNALLYGTSHSEMWSDETLVNKKTAGSGR